ncbi:hypothetical protein F2P81_019552 [Scophthalmus maximus]|uniref:Uncharacterized protein n=1 Tax=Scophthalmus maximus TaxID=52904 RepID=A0A6A4S845_SCOMX|nr:hypothetical protein F2P81_019552 [Scophthalmus maximus]
MSSVGTPSDNLHPPRGLTGTSGTPRVSTACDVIPEISAQRFREGAEIYMSTRGQPGARDTKHWQTSA